MEDFTLLNKTITVCAKRNSGKSYLIKYLVDLEKNRFSKIFVICPTECINYFYQLDNLVSSECVFEEYKEDWVNQLINRLTKINANKPKAERKNVLLILDDLVADNNFHSSQSIKKLYARCRHFSCSVIMTTQYLNSIPPIIRLNSDYVLVGQLNRQSIQLLLDEYMSGNIERDEFIDLYYRATQDYGFLVINNNSVKDNDDLNSIYGIIKTPSKYF
jgi:hypothetical protein